MSDTVDCPSCDDTFDTQRGMRIHHKRVHDESLRERATCRHCETEFLPSDNAEGKFCSLACFNASQRGERLDKECPKCDDAFETRPSDDATYCSQACADAAKSRKVRRECDQCGKTYHAQRSRNKRFCCRMCWREHKVERPRPDDVVGLCWLLYVYEDLNHTQTYRAQRAVLGTGDCLRKTQVKAILDALGVFHPDGRYQRALADVDPDEIGGPMPEGHDAWRDVRERVGGDD